VCGIASAKSCFDCEQQFCVNHIYSCADCGNQYCGACLDAHHANGHWADSDTALELAAPRGLVRASSVNSPGLRCSELAASCGVVRSSSVNPFDLRRSELAASRGVVRSSSVNPFDLRRSSLATSNQYRHASLSAIPIKLKSLLSQHLTHLATLIDSMFQNAALQSEVGL
jgi:hypothetical protein